MAQGNPLVVLDSDADKPGNPWQTMLTFKGKNSPDIISISSDEEMSATNAVTPNTILSFENRSFPDIISVSSVEETRSITMISLCSGSSVLSWSSVGEEIFPAVVPRSSRVIPLESYSSEITSVICFEELNTSKTNKGNIAYHINYEQKSIEEICICCGSLEIHSQHPLFHGGICAPCTESLLERFFLCEDDGFQAICTICCWGNSLLMCDDPKCHRCFCEECVDSLISPGFSEEIKKTDPWKCFMCVPLEVHGLLKRKVNWNAELKHFYDRESSHLQIYQPLQKWEKKPINVLSLFDNITQEMKHFGFLGESMGNGKLKYLDDVTDVTRKHIEEWGPFDFIFGSTPPMAKSYKQPTAWYFYQYFRILQYGKPTENKNKPFFWMFLDNIVLEEEDRDTASRFFKMEPVLIYKQHGNIQNAVHIWSNVPSVNSKYSASPFCMDLHQLAENICRTRIFSQRPAAVVREFFVPLKEYFKTKIWRIVFDE